MIRGMSRYLGVVFIAVVIVPAVVLGLLAVRSIGREEAYIEAQLGRTLTAEVGHVADLVAAEISGIQRELAASAAAPGGDPSGDLEAWKARSLLVDVPFLLSADFEVLWPRPDGGPRAQESHFIEKQQAFLTNEAEVPVYENIAVAYKDEILGEEGASRGTTEGGESGQPVAEVITGAVRRPEEARVQVIEDAAESEGQTPHVRGGRAGDTRLWVDSLAVLDRDSEDKQSAAPGSDRYDEQSRKQVATSLFLQSEPVREKTYQAAEQEGQQIAYRNVAPTSEKETGPAAEEQPRLEGKGAASALPAAADQAGTLEQVADGAGPAAGKPAALEGAGGRAGPAAAAGKPEQTAARKPPSREAPERAASGRASEDAARLKSIFVSQPLRLSEIVARGESGLVPLAVDGETRLLFWQRLPAGRILGCLVSGRQVRERIVGTLPGIYSASRLLTVLDERGLPLVVPQGEEARDWRRPFVAREISELLPRWEVAAYLTDPGAISSRARSTSVVMWLLIFIMFVSIVTGGTLVVRSASAEFKLARQKTDFVANVSHELKTPLTSIRMFAEMLRDGRQPSEEKRRQYLDTMTAETERLTRLINNVLDFARAEQGKKRYTLRVCDLVALTSSIVESQRARLESAGFTVGLLVRTERLPVNADEEAIKQALVNLLSNAEKYSDRSRDIEVSVSREDGKAVAGVSDRGVGIAPGEAGKIFGEFYRVDDALTSRVKGTGLGLTIARRIARDHGGDVVYAPREGGGSTFKIVLPLARETA